MNTLFVVGCGGAIGSMLRVIVSRSLPAYILGTFPLQILLINIIGCFFMGLFATFITLHFSVSGLFKSFLLTGILGGFTTFSAFSLEFFLLFEKKQFIYAGAYALSSFVLTIGFFLLGVSIARYFYS